MKFLLPLLALLYAVSPYDLFPDFFVGFGWFDDLVILFLLWWYFFIYRKRQHKGEGYDSTQAENSIGEKATPQTPYIVLGVGKDASGDEIKTAYRRLANKYHPDRVSHLGEEFRELAERRFKEIQEAYQELRAR